MEKKEKMFALVVLWRESSLTRKVFAEQHGINMGTFTYWCRKHSNELLKPVRQEGFVELVAGSKAVCQSIDPVAELEFPGGLRLKIY